jgi:hypothetical protein
MHKKWMKEPKYRKAYEALEEQFVMASAVTDVRNRASLSQEEVGAAKPSRTRWRRREKEEGPVI